MITWLSRDSVVSCVKLPPAVAFPTDDRLLQRIEESRRALPPNSVKALCRSRAGFSEARPALHMQQSDVRLELGVGRSRAAPETFAEPRWTLPATVHIEDVYARSRLAARRG